MNKMIKVGLERLEQHLDLFKDKRVGLITNPTGVTKDLISTGAKYDIESVKASP